MKRTAWIFLAALATCGLRGNTQTVAVDGASSRIRLVPQSTDTLVADMEESADGTRLITHDRRFAPRLWDAKSFRLLQVLGGAEDPVPVVRFSQDGTRILTMGREVLRVWDAKKAKLISRYAAPEGAFFVEAQFSPNAKSLALGTSQGMVLVVDAETGKESKRFTGLKTFVPALDWTGDGSTVVAGSEGTAVAFNVATGKTVEFKAPTIERIRSLDVNAQGTLVAVSDLFNNATVFELATGKAKYTVPHVVGDRTEELRSMVGAQFVLEKESSLLYFDKAGDLVLVDASTGTEQKRLKGHSAPVDEVRLNRDRTRAGTHGDDERVIVWDLKEAKQTPFKLRPGDLPTAATFGSISSEWYLGLASGELRKYNVATGAEASGTLGATNTLARIRFLGNNRLMAISKSAVGSIFLENLSESKSLVLPARSQDTELFRFANELVSDSGRYNLADKAGNLFFPPAQYVGYDLWANKGLFESTSERGISAEFIPNSDIAMMTFSDGSTFSYDFQAGKEIHSVNFKDPATTFTGTVSPDGTLGAHGPYDTGKFVVVWDLEKKAIVTTLDGAPEFDISALKFSHDSDHVVGAGAREVAMWNAENGKLIFRARHQLEMPPTNVLFSRDGSKVLAYNPGGWSVMPVAAPNRPFTKTNSPTLWRDMDQHLSKDGSRLLTWWRNNVAIQSTTDGTFVGQLQLNDAAVGAIYSPNDDRILTVDLTDGIVIWDAKTLKRLGNCVQMRDGSWLIMDPAGRYDATDPNNVTGALYVLEWEKGLEPIDVAQFKGLFWDPGLLTKLLGTNKERLRDVPNLSSLKLYPEVSIQADRRGNITVGLEERDGGGIGRAVVSVNGKDVVTKSGVGYFRVEAEDIKPYLLPANRLPDGKGNIVSVRASNSAGTLTSLPTNLDLGVPAGLQSPDVKLFALFVGAGDYVGQTRDLSSPPNDARQLATAMKKVSGGFLSNRVNVTELSTSTRDASVRPTRENILKWFDETAKAATSSDIVFVFFAGHGIDKVGDRSGYFFLTSEADPDSLTAANVLSVSISGEDLRQKLRDIPANKQIVVLDTCHSGAAAGSLVEGVERSVSGDYQRAWESIKEATGTWMLAGSAADQLSYESPNVDHGMLTYSLLEAINNANADGLRPGQGGELFVDVERWLTYAANRVESLKNEVGLKGIQRPEFKRSTGGGSFDIGVLSEKDRGGLGLKPPRPVVLVGPFDLDEEDPEGLEDPIRAAFGNSDRVKAWLDVAKHPNVYRVAGQYSVSGNMVTVRVFLQRFDGNQKRATVETFEVSDQKGRQAAIAEKIRAEIETRILKLEAERIAE